MAFYFATCDRQRALGFLKKLYPSAVIEDAPESAGPLLDLVERDVMRIPDPDFHQPAQVIPGDAWNEAEREACVAICQAFHERATAQQ